MRRVFEGLLVGLVASCVVALMAILLNRYPNGLIFALVMAILLSSLVLLIMLGADQRDKAANAMANERKKTGYRLCILVGNKCLNDLGNAMQYMSYPIHTETQMNDLAQFVMRYARDCQDWMKKAQDEVEDAAGKPGLALINSQALIRQQPSYVTNSLESQVWIKTASLLDWLRVELDKLS